MARHYIVIVIVIPQPETITINKITIRLPYNSLSSPNSAAIGLVCLNSISNFFFF